jgi:uncharacterized protein (TIGR03086 family)
MSTQPYEMAIASTRTILASVKPNQLSGATPCASWKMSDLINHVVGAQHFFASAMEGVAPAAGEHDFASGDYMAAFDTGTSRALAAFRAEGAMGKIVHLPFGDMPGAAFVGIAATDTFTHGWDMAKSMGESTDLAPELAAGLLAGARGAISDGFRGADGVAPFGAEQKAPAGATNADQLAAFLGRQV